jgi:hypothetical protein
MTAAAAGKVELLTGIDGSSRPVRKIVTGPATPP